jgi:DNA replication protein DnaC
MVSIALALKACMAGYKVLFTTIPLLVTTLKESNSAKTLRYFENRFEKYDLVVTDELGYTSFDREETDLLFNNLSLRAARKSTIITSNLSFERWIEVFGDPTVTSAMIDRLTYKAILVDMEGDSLNIRK